MINLQLCLKDRNDHEELNLITILMLILKRNLKTWMPMAGIFCCVIIRYTSESFVSFRGLSAYEIKRLKRIEENRRAFQKIFAEVSNSPVQQ